MARPRYKINSTDWLDCLDWLEFQTAQTHWLNEPDHPIHSLGLATLKECILQWRDVLTPTQDLCNSVQEILTDSLSMEDWGRLRKSLSARKRRRKEKRIDAKPVNITLTGNAHRLLTDYRQMSATSTLSEAIEVGLQGAMETMQLRFEKQLTQTMREKLKDMKASEFVKIVTEYLRLTLVKRSYANSCKVALSLFHQKPDRDKLMLVRDRFIEDIVWNEVHLKVKHESLGVLN